MGCGCGCSGAMSGCLGTAALFDPYAAMGAIGGNTSAPECDTQVPTVFDQKTVDDLRNHVDPDMRSTNAEVERCTRLPEDERARWRLFYASWRTWADTKPSLWQGWDPFLGPFGSNLALLRTQWETGCAMSRELSARKSDFRDKYGCAISGPSNIDRPDPFDFSGAIKWGAIAVATVAVVYGVATVVKTIR